LGEIPSSRIFCADLAIRALRDALDKLPPALLIADSDRGQSGGEPL
jgi:hypothetical protein